MRRSWSIKCRLKSEKGPNSGEAGAKRQTIYLHGIDIALKWAKNSEIPPRPPLIKGGWGDFPDIHQRVNIAFVAPA
jgi:hypothetical protein